MNKERVDLFAAVYKIELKKARENFPEFYSWPETDLDLVFNRMMDAVLRGSYNKDGQALKATFKAFGLRHTYKALNAFLEGV